MGLLFAFGTQFHGSGAELPGPLGPILGWPVFMATQVLTGNRLGAATGEWHGAGRSPPRRLALGVTALVAAIFFFGQGKSGNHGGRNANDANEFGDGRATPLS